MISVFDKIIEKLAKYPQVKYEFKDEMLVIHSETESGFTVSLYYEDEEFQVYFEGWHEEFDSEDDALNSLAFGLSSECRLKEYSRGGAAYKWIVQYKENDEWINDSTTALFFFQFWKRKEIRYLQNNLIN